MFAGLLSAAGCNNAATLSVPVQNAATSATAGDHADPAHDAPRISLADAKKAFDDGAVIVDVRDVNAYKQEHIKGALNIPLSDVAANMDKLPKDKKIIVYCS